MTSNELLKVEHLKKYFPVRRGVFSSLKGGKSSYVRAVNDVSFTLGEREILGFVGESCCACGISSAFHLFTLPMILVSAFSYFKFH